MGNVHSTVRCPKTLERISIKIGIYNYIAGATTHIYSLCVVNADLSWTQKIIGQARTRWHRRIKTGRTVTPNATVLPASVTRRTDSKINRAGSSTTSLARKPQVCKHICRDDNIARAELAMWCLYVLVTSSQQLHQLTQLNESRKQCFKFFSNGITPNQTWNWVIGSPGQWVIWVIFHVRVTRSSFWPGVRPEFFWFSKKCPKCKTYIWNAEMIKVIVRCLLLGWNHWMSVHAMNFYVYFSKRAPISTSVGFRRVQNVFVP